MSIPESQLNALKKYKAVFHRALSNDRGKELLETLRGDFQERGLMAETPEQTAYNVGQWELVQFMIDMSRGSNE